MYLSEDATAPGGLLYRFTPAHLPSGLHTLRDGGVLEALRVPHVEDLSVYRAVGTTLPARWKPVPDPSAKMNRIILEGSIPSPANPPKGCKFHTRCREVMEICKTVVPLEREYEPGHMVKCHLYNDRKALNEETTEAV